MITVEKNGRVMHAMVMNEAEHGVRGVAQCGLPGCEAYMAIVEHGVVRSTSGNVEDQTPNQQLKWFLEHHECRALPRTGGT